MLYKYSEILYKRGSSLPFFVFVGVINCLTYDSVISKELKFKKIKMQTNKVVQAIDLFTDTAAILN